MMRITMPSEIEKRWKVRNRKGKGIWAPRWAGRSMGCQKRKGRTHHCGIDIRHGIAGFRTRDYK
jgi:hypothetical protein